MNVPEKKLWYSGLKSKTDEFKNEFDKVKNITRNISRKEISFGFIERFTRKLYANPYHLAKLEFIQYIIFIALIYYYNPMNITTKYPAFTNVLVLSVSFIYVILFIFIKDKVENNEDVDLIDPTESNIIFKFISLLLFFSLFMLAIKGFIWLLANTALLSIFQNMIGLFIFIGVLALVYVYFRKSINKIRNSSGKNIYTLIFKFIMYLPCLLIDTIEYTKYQFNLTTKPVWILLGVEGGLIGLYFLVPFLFEKIMTANGLKLLNKPTYLSQENTLGNYKQLHSKKINPNLDETGMNMDELYSKKINEEAQKDINANPDSLDNVKPKVYTDPNIPKNRYLAWIYNKLKNPTWIKVEKIVHPQYTDTELQRFRYSYALSGWFYINPQPPNTRSAYTMYTNILKYGNKVNLEYNGQLNSLRVMANVATTGDDIVDKPNDSVEIYETKNVLYQKWNNIVINYDGGILDVFINGELVVSRSGVAPYMTQDSIVVGAPTGILGGICNVTYYDSTLNTKQIELNYKALQGKSNPYIWSLKDDVNINIKQGKKQSFIEQIKHTFSI